MSVWEPCDDFEGPWKLVKLTGCDSLGATSQFYFWGHDGMGQLDFAAVAGFLECKYGETPEGLPAVTFKLDGLPTFHTSPSSREPLLLASESERGAEARESLSHHAALGREATTARRFFFQSPLRTRI